MHEVLLVAAGGAIGASLRYLINVAFLSRGAVGFPWHTLLINLLGAFLLGLLASLTAEKGVIDAQYALFMGTGILGGFTTFSALAYESVVLIEGGSSFMGLGNILGSGLVGLVAAWLGLVAGRSL